jgi:hypothetical protein
MSKGFEHWNEAFDEDKFDKLSKPVSFKEEVYELAFGDDAINKGYTEEEVLAMIREFSDKALAFDQTGLDINDALDSDYCPN